MDYSACWGWVQSLDLGRVSSLNWSRRIEFLQNTLACDSPKYFRREWNQRSRENTDFAIVSKARGRSYKQWSHCHKHVLEAMVKNISRLGRGSAVELDLDGDIVENLLRILYTRRYVSVESITKNHHRLIHLVDDLSLVPDRVRAVRNYLRAEFHRFASDPSFLQLKEAELGPYLNVDTLPLYTALDLNFILDTCLRWAAVCGQDALAGGTPRTIDCDALVRIISVVCALLHDLHGELTLNTDSLRRYADHIATTRSTAASAAATAAAATQRLKPTQSRDEVYDPDGGGDPADSGRRHMGFPSSALSSSLLLRSSHNSSSSHDLSSSNSGNNSSKNNKYNNNNNKNDYNKNDNNSSLNCCHPDEPPRRGLVLVSSDHEELACRESELCRVPYFKSLLHGGFRESLQQGRVCVNLHSSMLRVMLTTLEAGRLADLPVDRLLDTYMAFDYVQSDELLHAFDAQLRRNFLAFAHTSLDELLAELSPALVQRVLPMILRDMTDAFGLNGYAFVLRFLLLWLRLDASRDDWLPLILSSTLKAANKWEHMRPVVYESFDGVVHMFDGKTWAPCHWADFDSMREGVYNFKVVRYKQCYLAHNFLRSNTITLNDSISGKETVIVRHVDNRCGYFIEMLGQAFCSVGSRHYLIDDDMRLREVDLPSVDGFALEPRCVDSPRRRIYFHTEQVGFCVRLDENFVVAERWQFSSAGVSLDYQLHALEGHILALRLGYDAYVLDHDLARFVLVEDYFPKPELISTSIGRLFVYLDGVWSDSVQPLVTTRLLPKISGVIYKIFDLDDQTFLIVTEDVELTQARLRVSETESDPKVVGFFRWCSEERKWEDVSSQSRIPKTQLQQTVVLNHPGLPLYARRAYNTVQ